MPLERLGVFGGTFDPIHVGHLICASDVAHELQLDRVLFVPAGRPWQKDAYSDAEDRFLMTVLATSAHPRFAVSRIEIDRRGPTYAIDSMIALRRFYGPEAKLYLIVGADAVEGLATWHRIAEMGALAEIVAVGRPGFELPKVEAQAGWPRISVVGAPQVDVSSTDIRRRVAQNRPIDFLVTEEVATYIGSKGLYVDVDGMKR